MTNGIFFIVIKWCHQFNSHSFVLKSYTIHICIIYEIPLFSTSMLFHYTLYHFFFTTYVIPLHYCSIIEILWYPLNSVDSKVNKWFFQLENINWLARFQNINRWEYCYLYLTKDSLIARQKVTGFSTWFAKTYSHSSSII